MKYWIDGNDVGCQHLHQYYVGSFVHEELVLGSTMPRVEKLDIYVFPQSGGDTVCIRYGDEGHQYYSPGSLIQFIQTASLPGHTMYKDALQLIRTKGKIRYEQSI